MLLYHAQVLPLGREDDRMCARSVEQQLLVSRPIGSWEFCSLDQKFPENCLRRPTKGKWTRGWTSVLVTTACSCPPRLTATQTAGDGLFSIQTNVQAQLPISDICNHPLLAVAGGQIARGARVGQDALNVGSLFTLFAREGQQTEIFPLETSQRALPKLSSHYKSKAAHDAYCTRFPIRSNRSVGTT